MNTTLVTGATGNVGAELVRLLGLAGVPPRAAVRDIVKARQLLGEKAEYVQFDFERPETFAPAVQGVSQLFLVRPPAITDVKHAITPLISAARAAGVRQIVFLSLLGAESNRFVPHYAIEAAIRASGIDWVFLRASFFMQNLSTTHRADIQEHGAILVPAGNGRTSFIDVRDLAEVAAIVLREAGHARQAYPLTGASALTYAEVAAIMSEELGRQISYPAPSPLAFARAMRARGYSRGFVLVMLGIYTAARLGLAASVTPDTARLLGRPPRTVRDFVRDYRASWL